MVAAIADRTRTSVSVPDLLLDTWPSRFAPESLQPHVAVGEGGLGLDSVDIVELLLACEELSGIPVADALFTTESPLTIGRIAAHFGLRSTAGGV